MFDVFFFPSGSSHAIVRTDLGMVVNTCWNRPSILQSPRRSAFADIGTDSVVLVVLLAEIVFSKMHGAVKCSELF